MEDAACLPLYATLADRIADHGLIAVVVLRPAGAALEIADWLMSCRVLSRGVESALMNLVFGEAARRHCTHVRGRYRKTAKNALVSDFFERFGFARVAGDSSAGDWELSLDAYREAAVHIDIATSSDL